MQPSLAWPDLFFSAGVIACSISAPNKKGLGQVTTCTRAEGSVTSKFGVRDLKTN